MGAATARRKAIRDAVHAQVVTALGGEVGLEAFTHRRFSVRDGSRTIAQVFFAEGEIDRSVSDREDQGELVIRVATRTPLDIDDQLDDMMGRIEDQLDTDPDLGGTVDWIRSSRYQYGIDEQTGFSWLAQGYRVQTTTDL